jgi:predicted CoA-binding protein
MNDDVIRAFLTQSKVIAVVGLSRDPTKTSRSVTSYMMSKGYHIVPVNPSAASVMGEVAYPSLADLPPEEAQAVDIVDIFRPSEDLPAIVNDAVASLPNLRVIWAQLGIQNDQAAEIADQAGVPMVQNRCIRVEHARLV